jgi:inhibitor of cysteine peptidase
MVQKEVKKKTKIYGAVAVLSAIILVTLIYSFGAAPIVFPPNQTPFVAGMKVFTSLDQLRNYLGNTTQGIYSYSGGPLDSHFFNGMAPQPTAVPAAVPQEAGTLGMGSSNSAARETSTFSTTNVQVFGVDEADTVKTDGQYIYTISTTQNLAYGLYGFTSETSNTVYVLSADPQNPQIVSKISLGNDTQPAGLYLSSDGNKLVVLASRYQSFNYGGYYGGPSIAYPANSLAMPMIPAYQANVYTYINVYDISDKANPLLTRNFTVSGSYFDSRMIGNYVYAVVSQPAQVYGDNVTLPGIYKGNSESPIPPTSIYYTDMVQPTYYTFTSFFGINVLDDTEQPTNMTVMMGGASTMYVSPNNIYVTYPTWTDQGQFTSVYRISINGAQLSSEAQGSVPGYLINQYSMDEDNNGYFRVATTWDSQSQVNNIYVLNSSLDIVGKLEGLAQGERIYAARFMGDKCYLVTFKQTDPFFVIDLSNPQVPSVAGELKIPGFSSFLQPYDENHVIGLGMIVNFSGGTETRTLKVSLFDVTDVTNPMEIANYIVEGNDTTSTALNDPKAILFDLQKQLLVIPVSITNYGYVQQNIIVVPPSVSGANSTGSTKSGTGEISPGATGNSGVMVMTYENWQGAYVFKVNPTSGFTLKGTVTNLNATLLDSNGFINGSSYYYNSYNAYITRSLYIGNTLYTVSNSEVKLTSLADMTQIGQINLS